MARSLSNDAYKSFIAGLIGARRSSGLSQVELASRLETPQSYISKVERCERRLDVMEFCGIARALGAEPGLLLDGILQGMSPTP